ncbi:MAG: hypothetical protein LBU87_04715 [Lactobacillales bacterium]|jgi:hypothetical protein|nr:hypothetical protein [Lactobacillales bacterium]
MKKILSFCLFVSVLSACSADWPTNTESRSTTWYNQTAEDLYENFGAPTWGILYPDGERYLYYHSANITREWTERKYHYCDITFMLQDNRVYDWSYTGNQCTLNVRE